MGFFKEFKEFAMRGNVIDMAVGIIIGGAFGKIISSFVNDVIMPPIGLILGGMDFKELKILIKSAGVDVAGAATPPVFLNYGMFVQTVVDFLIIAFVIFLMIKAMNKLKRTQEEVPAAPPEPTAQEKLLVEIRDILKSK